MFAFFISLIVRLIDRLIAFLRMNVDFHAKCFIHYISASLQSLPRLSVASCPVFLNTIRNCSNAVNFDCFIESVEDCSLLKALPRVFILLWQLL